MTENAATSPCCATDGSRHSAPAETSVGTRYNVTGMTCGHCSSAVAGALTGLPGVTRADVDLTSGRVTVTSDGEPDDALVAEAVDETGYTVTGRA